MQNGQTNNGPVTLPSSDPGNNGGGALMASSSQPSVDDFEDLFGPAGRDVRQDPQRHKRHQRWHLPDVLKGTNSFLTDRIDGLISDATESPFTSVVLPYQYTDNPDQALSWDVYAYDEGLASRVPYESAARVLTQTKQSHSAYIVRQGLAISMEHNFMMSERGRKDFNNQLLQLVGSIQYTNDLDVHMALITSPNYERTEAEKYAYNDSDPFQVLRKHVDMFGMCQKNPNGLDVLIEDAKQVFKKWGASEPTFMLCNSKLGYQQNMTLEKTQYVTNGVDGIKRLKAGPDMKSYRGLNVIHSRHFSMEAGRQPRDLLNRRVRVAEHYAVPPMTAVEMDNRTVLLYDEGRDQMVPISCAKLYNASRINEDPTFEDILAVGKDHQRIPSDFWNHLMFDPVDRSSTFSTAEIKFGVWLTKGNVHLSKKQSLYHPEFLRKYLKLHDSDAFKRAFEDEDFTGASMMDVLDRGNVEGDFSLPTTTTWVTHMKKMFRLDDVESCDLINWITFIQVRRQTHTQGFSNLTDHAVCHLHSHVTMSDIKAVFSNDYDHNELLRLYRCMANIEGFDGGNASTDTKRRTDSITPTSIVYAMTLPHIASVYSRAVDWKGLINKGGATADVMKRSLFMVRPSIEHYMLGIIVGRGGTGELGATLWGQTELSCYDDAMHGKWGMNYKYHARAVVFNEKHLLRLWDISFNGYTGGMGTDTVDWENTDDWFEATNALDEPLKHSFPDMFVMNFEPDDVIDGNLPNPINFHVKEEGDAKPAMADAENIYDTHQNSMDVFMRMGRSNLDKYNAYYKKMPNYSAMHAGRKAAGHAAHEGDTHTASLSFSGTMQIKSNTGQFFAEVRGTGHCGDSAAGSASIRAGNGSMNAANPTPYRIM
jgi:hypothetical protein